MGFCGEYIGHSEGYTIGFIPREGCVPKSGLYRELDYPWDDEVRPVVLIAAGCECGWRSPRFEPSEPTEWAPHSVLVSPKDDDRVHALWKEHHAAVERDPKSRKLPMYKGSDPGRATRGPAAPSPGRPAEKENRSARPRKGDYCDCSDNPECVHVLRIQRDEVRAALRDLLTRFCTTGEESWSEAEIAAVTNARGVLAYPFHVPGRERHGPPPGERE